MTPEDFMARCSLVEPEPDEEPTEDEIALGQEVDYCRAECKRLYALGPALTVEEMISYVSLSYHLEADISELSGQGMGRSEVWEAMECAFRNLFRAGAKPARLASLPQAEIYLRQSLSQEDYAKVFPPPSSPVCRSCINQEHHVQRDEYVHQAAVCIGWLYDPATDALSDIPAGQEPKHCLYKVEHTIHNLTQSQK